MTQDDWTRWGDAHPLIAGIMQLGIYVLCWGGFLLGFGVVIALLSLLARGCSGA